MRLVEIVDEDGNQEKNTINIEDDQQFLPTIEIDFEAAQNRNYLKAVNILFENLIQNYHAITGNSQSLKRTAVATIISNKLQKILHQKIDVKSTTID